MKLWLIGLVILLIAFVLYYPSHIRNLREEAVEMNLEAHDLSYGDERVSPREHLRRQFNHE